MPLPLARMFPPRIFVASPRFVVLCVLACFHFPACLFSLLDSSVFISTYHPTVHPSRPSVSLLSPFICIFPLRTGITAVSQYFPRGADLPALSADQGGRGHPRLTPPRASFLPPPPSFRPHQRERPAGTCQESRTPAHSPPSRGKWMISTAWEAQRYLTAAQPGAPAPGALLSGLSVAMASPFPFLLLSCSVNLIFHCFCNSGV